MQRAGTPQASEPTTGPSYPTAIEQACATAARPPNGVAHVGELSHDLTERHERWLIEQYLEGQR